MHNPALDNFIQESNCRDLKLEWKWPSNLKLEWLSGFDVYDKTATQINNVYQFDRRTILVLLGNSEECTSTFVGEFARIYSTSNTQVYK